MPELSEVAERLCLRGHGAMDPVPGLWAFDQIQAVVEPGSPRIVRIAKTGTFYGVQIFVCRTCRSIEIVDFDMDSL